MGRLQSKKRGSKKADEPKTTSSNSSRLNLLKRKLELEQQMIEEGKVPEGKEIEEIDKELEEAEPKGAVEEQGREEEKKKEQEKEEKSGEAAEEKDVISVGQEEEEREAVEKVEDMVALSRKRAALKEESAVSFVKSRSFAARVKQYQKVFADVRKEVAKVVVGQDEAVKGMMRALIADGHVLVEGVPGIAKTTLIRTLAKTTACSFSRIQFTPDLLPTDIIGISTYQEGRGFYTLKGPIFSNFILADEINRAPPKVQSALLESMAEKQATIAKESFPVPLPFFTMATQNPIENVGTYSLPEAQIDRFLFKIYMGYPDVDEEQDILRTNITSRSFDSYDVKPVLSPDSILNVQEDGRKIYVDKKVERYIVKLVDATRLPKKYGISIGKYVEYGASPRGSIGLFNAARAEALLNGQTYVTPHNVKTIAYDVLRHRLLLSYEGQAEGIKTEEVIKEILKKVPVP